MPTVELIATHVTNRLRTASGHVAMQGVNTRTAAAGNGIPATGREPDPHLILLHDLSLVWLFLFVFLALYRKTRLLEISLLFFFYWRCNPLWVLAFSVIFFHSALSLHQCFSTFMRPQPGKFFFYKTRARSQQIYSQIPFRFFKVHKTIISINNTGQQNLTFFFWHTRKNI